MSLKSYLRTVVPRPIWQTIGFCRRLPSYWRIDRSDDLTVRRGIKGLPLFLDAATHVFIPENLTAYVEWKLHGIGDYDSAQETRDFLELAKDRTALIDIGAQTGFMSALFARSRPGSFKVLSVEPDPQVFPILLRAKELNKSQNGDWQILPIAVSNITGKAIVPVSNWLFESRGVESPREMEVQVIKLSDLVVQMAWTPDIIKIDVESFEYEILTSSLEFLAREKPSLQLEVHWKILASRGRPANDFLTLLADIGYRGIRKRYRDLAAWRRASRVESVSRLSLCVV